MQPTNLAKSLAKILFSNLALLIFWPNVFGSKSPSLTIATWFGKRFIRITYLKINGSITEFSSVRLSLWLARCPWKDLPMFPAAGGTLPAENLWPFDRSYRYTFTRLAPQNPRTHRWSIRRIFLSHQSTCHPSPPTAMATISRTSCLMQCPYGKLPPAALLCLIQRG